MKVNANNIKAAITEYIDATSKKARKAVAVETDEGTVKLLDIVNVEETDKGLTFSFNDGTQVATFSAKAGRCYFKKLPATIELMDGEDEVEGDEGDEGNEDEERETPVICKDRSRYEPYARGNRISQDCADFVAKTLRAIEDVEELMARGTDFLTEIEAELPKKSDAKSWPKHVAKWDGLNKGHRRMLMGCAIRTAERKADADDTLKEFHKALKAAFTVKK